ncbi:FHA domain-containing protein [Leucobacter sp. Z1108]|uniref:FHA domain-containing protein n=1 Tax=Leucobacter sp. Z1108 TaxID=3439066 RepID=UPI003F3E8BC6
MSDDVNAEDQARRDDQTEVRSTEQFRGEVGAMVRARTTDLSVGEQDAVQALPSGAALLVVRRGANLGARFLLDQAITVAGRHPEVDIFLDDVTVSRKHAEFRRVGVRFLVHDLGSLNGTYVDGHRIDGDRTLEDGVEVQVGKFKFTFFASRFDLPYQE